jgi:hypothetical protein
MNWLKELAPMIGTALAGPLGGIAASFIADKLGVEEKTVKAHFDMFSNFKHVPDKLKSSKTTETDAKIATMQMRIAQLTK